MGVMNTGGYINFMIFCCQGCHRCFFSREENIPPWKLR